MDRDIPSFNRSVMDRIYAKNHQLHLKRLKNIKSSISSNKPYLKPQITSLANSNSNIGVNYHTKLPQYNNLKKEVALQTKNAQIERENAILFQKMIKIMKRPDKNNDPGLNKQRTSTNITRQRMSMQFSKINQQNRALFHRLQSQRPTIDNKKLQQERVKNLNILKFLGKYPNYEAIAKTHNRSFQLKSRRMNSTVNRGFYNNSNEEEGYYEAYMNQEDGGSNLIEFHNEMAEYNRDLRRAKMQHYEGRMCNNKLSATQPGFSHNRRGKQVIASSTNNSRVLNEFQMGSKIEIYQPVVPNRRRYLSQNQPRRSEHNSQAGIGHQLNTANHHETSMDQEAEFRAFHLNHPSHNIVIEDQSVYNRCKKWNMRGNNNRVMNQADAGGETNFNKNKKAGVIQHQRKLNTKNSQQNIFTLNQQTGPVVKGQGNLIVSDFNTEVSEPVPIPRFAHGQQQVQRKTLNKNMIQNNADNIIEEAGEYDQQLNKNVILLYKGVVALGGLLLQQQKGQLLRDIDNEMNQQGGTDELVQIPMSLLDCVLGQLVAEISIYRLFDSYKISIEVNANGRINQLKGKVRDSQQQQQQIGSIEKQFDSQLVEWLRNIILQRMGQIDAVEIPQVEGSMLLEGMDYDYKGFIRMMVRVEKDSEGEQERQGLYRVAIVLEHVDKQMQGNNQFNVNVKQQQQQQQQHTDTNDAQNIDHNSQQENNNYQAENDQQQVLSTSQQQQNNESSPKQQEHEQQQQEKHQHSQQQQHSELEDSGDDGIQDSGDDGIQDSGDDGIQNSGQNHQEQQQHQDTNTPQGDDSASHNYVQALDEQLL